MADVAIYVRLSEEDRNKTNKEQDSESIVNQRSMLCEYASERGWNIYKVYADDDYSGSDATRPAFNEMINDARDKKFQVVLCKSLSRFARDISMVETYINGYFIEWGIRFISISDYADSSQKGNRKNIQINSLVNQWYLEDLSENIKSVMTHKKKQGQFTGSFAPYGYIKSPEDSHKLVIDEEAAGNVRRIYKMYLDGYGYKAISKTLNDDGVANPSKYRLIKGFPTNRKDDVKLAGVGWSDHTVWQILKNPNYTGDLVQCRYGKPTYKSKSIKEKVSADWVVVNDVHEPIISKDDYDRVQELKKARRAYKRREASALPPNIFAGLVKCKVCGRSLVISTGGLQNKNSRYLRCSGRKSGIVNCNCAMVKYETLAEIVTEKIRAIINHYCDFDALQNKIHDKKDYYNTEIAALQKSIEKNRLEQRKLDDVLSDSYTDKSTGVITSEEFTIISERLKTRKDELILNNNELQNKFGKLIGLKNGEENANQMVLKHKNFSNLSREVIEVFVSKILIGARNAETGDFELEIEYNI